MMNIKKIMVAVLAGITLAACTKDFEKINTDPDNLEKVSAATLLNPILYEMSTFNASRSEGFTMDIMQVRLPWPSVSGGTHRYVVTENAGNSTWNTYYRWLNNIREVDEAAIADNNNLSYRAIALTLKAWGFSLLTDCFGDVPMSEALKAEQNQLKPAFDKQEDIYKELLKNLDSANSWLTAPKDVLSNNREMLYDNDLKKWRKFANSLQMRLLLRISNRTETKAYEKLAAMVADPVKYPVFSNNAEAALYKITGITPNISPWSRVQDFVNFRCAGEFFVNTLNDFADPRRDKWLSQATDTAKVPKKIGFKGIPAGHDGSDGQFFFNPSNMLAPLGVAPTMIAVVMTYSEVEFIKAELAQKGLIAGGAQSYYENAVKASIEQWGATVPANYFQNPKAAYDGTLERIMLQKYIALFFNDYQQWFEYRRTKLPVLPVGPGMLNDKKMPVRFKYPLTVQTANPDNYRRAVTNMGGDDINTKVWWEK
ncbi:SusD/RagB family nutrient-binding outer membrane lipoprotein [Chitinophaga pendula]|uniref:SusD/RagB family nutrient-binding outer membrane lipoprotein n=1 Tax=Chitinophaga TaxID=79328 RepID=UPI0018DF574F|nr:MULTISPECIES: SusD/RagB family nutrient-binding outer membrane lipoprotein [Chitinophaga]UCJ05727.1 SusD/RagB family nutrient-binding outer membrane lipoprotein [Chitinophaga pendula]